MTRIAWILGAAILAVTALLTLGAALLPREALRTRLSEQISAWTGRDVSLRGEPELDLFPVLTVRLRDVQVAGPARMPDAPVISMERLAGTVRLWPLILGRVEIDSFRMVRPLIRLVRDAEGARNWAFDSGAAALQLAFAGDVPLGNFVIEDGTVLYENRQRQVVEQLDSVNLQIEWPSVRQQLAVTGSGIWRGEQVSLSTTAEAPFDFLNGDTTPVDVRLQSAPVVVDFTGAASDVNAPQLRGELSMSTPSLRGFVRWMGSPVGPGSTLGPAALAGTAVFRASVLSVDDADLTLDGNRATGAIEIAIGTTPRLTGTLALPALDLTSYFAALRTAQDPARNWRASALNTDWFRRLGADIRLSAASVTAGPLQLGQTAASVSLKEARLQIGIAQAAFPGGALTGNLSLEDAPEGPGGTLEAELRATDFDLGAAAAPLGLADGLTGTASIAANVRGVGGDLGAVVAGLTGTSRIDVTNGLVPLFGIAELAAPPAAASPPASPRSPVESVSVGLAFAGGAAIVEQSTIAAENFTANVKGGIVLADGKLALNGTVQRKVEGVSQPVAFTIDGTLAKPVARPLALAN